MKGRLKRKLTSSLALFLSFTLLVACNTSDPNNGNGDNGNGDNGNGDTASTTADVPTDERITIKVAYSDNPTLPFKADWVAVQQVEELANVDLEFDIIPSSDYSTKVSLYLNTQENIPDVILYQSTNGENANLAINGAIVPISDYKELTPHFWKQVEDHNLQSEVDNVTLADGKLYYLPSVFDKQFYDGGLIMRQDYLEANNIDTPTSYDDFYELAKAYKADHPDSYPLTSLVGYRVLERMVMPSWGISLGGNSSSGSYVLSYDFDKGEYFTGATSDQMKSYLEYMHKLYAEGLLDPEFQGPVDGDAWANKLATGQAMATYAYYDQIGGVESNSDIEGFKLNLFPPLEGPGGAHHQPKSRVGSGPLFPAKTLDNDNFERIVSAIDTIFYSPEGAEAWSMGQEGVTYEIVDNEIVYNDTILSSPEGIYKTTQKEYGTGSAVTQMVWSFDEEMTKYDENYKQINEQVAAMDNAIQQLPPSPILDDMQSEEVGLIQTPLADKYDVWVNEFITGVKSLDTDWDTYVQEMIDAGIEDMLEIYNSNLR